MMTWEEWKEVELHPDWELRECPHCHNVGAWRKSWHPDECPHCLRYISTGKKIGE
jgi:hypothetical protein